MSDPPTAPPGPWGEIQLPRDGAELSIDVGDLRISALAAGDELRLGSRTPTAEPRWQRWVLGKSPGSLGLKPALPGRPVVVLPEQTFTLGPGRTAKIFVRIPVVVCIDIPGGDAPRIAEFPTQLLSDTWFGELDHGEVCYFVSSSARREAPPSPFPADAVCAPILIENDSQESLTVERICLRVDGLGIYQCDGDLWTSLTRVTFRGGEHSSEVIVVPGPPEDASGAAIPIVPEAEQSSNRLKKTFRSLLDIAGIGNQE